MSLKKCIDYLLNAFILMNKTHKKKKFKKKTDPK